MIRIRTKLLIFFLLFIFILNGVAFFLAKYAQESIYQYDNFLSRFFLLNQIAQNTDNLYLDLQTYLNQQTSADYKKYLKDRNQLKSLQQQIPQLKTAQNTLSLKNYENMITSYLEESGIVSGAFQNKQIDSYSRHLIETENIKGYIHQTTLDLINSELTYYKGFYHNLQLKDNYLRKMAMFTFLSTIFLSLFFAYWFSRSLTIPIARLTKGAREISKGKFDGPPIKISTKDEMSLLTGTFNHMRTSIIELIEEMKEKAELDRLVKEMELNHLQSQINPHFLFNVLNTISKKSYIEGAEETSHLIDSVAALLRYNLGNLNHPVTLREEIKVVKEYFYIQATRFQNRVQFNIEEDEQALNQRIPNLTIQPLVENAFIHGIESYEKGGRIEIHIKDYSNVVKVIVRDNGVGMDEEIRESILSTEVPKRQTKTSSGHSTGLGLKNVIRRLRLFYQTDDIIQIESSPGKGTNITLLLPKGKTNNLEEGEKS